MTEKQIPQLASVLVMHQSAFGGLTNEEGDWVIKKPKEAIGVMVQAVKKYRLQKTFKPIFTDRFFVIEALGGERIDDAELAELFPGGVDLDVKDWGLNEPGEPTAEISPKAYELQEDFSFADDWSGEFFVWSQVVRIRKKYPELFAEDFSVLFPVKKEKERFVACVRVYSGGLYVHVYRFGSENLWPVRYRYRVVVPQSLVS
jgi:hypothetical protein